MIFFAKSWGNFTDIDLFRLIVSRSRVFDYEPLLSKFKYFWQLLFLFWYGKSIVIDLLDSPMLWYVLSVRLLRPLDKRSIVWYASKEVRLSLMSSSPNILSFTTPKMILSIFFFYWICMGSALVLSLIFSCSLSLARAMLWTFLR